MSGATEVELRKQVEAFLSYDQNETASAVSLADQRRKMMATLLNGLAGLLGGLAMVLISLVKLHAI